MSQSIRAKRLLEASEIGGVNLFKEMAKVKGSKKFREDLPDVVSGVTGEGAIVEEFKKVYNELYNSFDTSEAMRELRGLVQGKVNQDSVLEINLITVEVVQRAVARLKSGKGDITALIYPNCQV